MPKHHKNKKQKQRKKISVFLYVAAGLVVFWLAVGCFFYFNKWQLPAGIFVSADNVKQGDTIFVRIESKAGQVAGNFGNEKLDFYKKPGSGEWVSFLGIDADQKPGDYTISVDTSNAEHLVKNIKVGLAGFSSVAAVPAPSSKKTGITQEQAVINIRSNDNPSLKKILDNATAAPYFSGPFSNPLSYMKVSGFSFGKFIGFGKNKLQHFGVDLRALENTDVFAVNDGKVALAVDLPNYGKTVVVDHGMDIFSMYLHLDKFDVSQGQMVKRGQAIGLSGNTGYVAGPHLHFSMRVGGERVDPVEFIKTSQQMNENYITASLLNAFDLLGI